MTDNNNFDVYSNYEDKIRMRIKESKMNSNSRLNKEEYGTEKIPINEHVIQAIKEQLRENDEG